MIRLTRLMPLRAALSSHLGPGMELPTPFLDCNAFFMGSSTIKDDPNDIDICVMVNSLWDVFNFLETSREWSQRGDGYPDSSFLSIKNQAALPVNIVATDDPDFFNATLLAQDVMQYVHNTYRNAFTDRTDRAILFDLIYKTCVSNQTPEEQDYEFDSDDFDEELYK